MPRKKKQTQWLLKGCGYKFRSGKERDFAGYLRDNKIHFTYEDDTFSYGSPIPGKCVDCGSTRITKSRVYHPDFTVFDAVTKAPIWLEYKGRFLPRDRTKMLHVQASHPEADIRFVFQVDNWMTQKHKSRYSDWCKSKGFKYCIKELPESWMKRFLRAEK